MGWQPEHDASLRDLIFSGFSFSQAAEIINKEHGTNYSRNACIGRAMRQAMPRTVKVRIVSADKTANRVKSDKRKAKRWAANPSLAYRAERLEAMKANRELMLAGGATVTSKAYRRHLPRQREMSKTELRTMLRTAIQNTADMGTPA